MKNSIFIPIGSFLIGTLIAVYAVFPNIYPSLIGSDILAGLVALLSAAGIGFGLNFLIRKVLPQKSLISRTNLNVSEKVEPSKENLLKAYKEWENTGFSYDSGGLKKLGVIIGILLESPVLISSIPVEKRKEIQEEVNKKK